jgi:uncharacterized repeat protein (TIGR01451 family)
MFNKLVSNLSFKTGITDQIVFYTKRLRAESAIRRIGLVFLGLALVMQLFAMSLPVHAQVSGTSNDIIWGGIGYNKGPDPKATLLSIYDSDTDGTNTGIRELLTGFNISRQDIVNSYLSSINSADHSLYSLGRNPHSSLDQLQTINGQNYYLRPLYSWGDNITYNVLTGVRSGIAGDANQQYFSIMLECGNIVVKYVQPPTQLTTPNKTTMPGAPVANSIVTRGETLGYRIFFGNNGGTANNVMMIDHVPNDTNFTWAGSSAANSYGLNGNQVIWVWNTIPIGANNDYVDMTVTVANSATNGEQICNTAYLNSAETPTLASQQVCFTVSVPSAPPPTPTPIPTPLPPPNINECKTATNVTQNLTNAQTKSANPGDIIQYTLTTTNKGGSTDKGFVISDNLKYVLQYSTIQNISDNGTVANNLVSWPAIDIPAGTTITHTFQVKVDNPLPTNAPLTTDTNAYNMKMLNVFGTCSVNIPLTTPTVLTAVAQPSNNLPNTGPGESLIIVFAVTTVAAYFYSRSRLLAKEASLAIEDHLGGEK